MQDEDATHALLQRLLVEDHDAWCELVRTYTGLLLDVARRTFSTYGFSTSRHDHEDVVSAVWQNLLANERRQVRTCIERRNLLPTLYVLVRNRCVDVMRRQKIEAEPIDDDCPVPAPDSVPDLDEPITPETGLAAMEILSPREKTCVELFFLHDRKYREITDITGIPINSIGPTLQRALDKMRRHIAGLFKRE